MNVHEIDFVSIRERNKSVIALEGEQVYNEAERFAMLLDPISIYHAELLIYAFYAGYAQREIDNFNKAINDTKKKLEVV